MNKFENFHIKVKKKNFHLKFKMQNVNIKKNYSEFLQSSILPENLQILSDSVSEIILRAILLLNKAYFLQLFILLM